ncbi:MAG: C10 family peptidase, partial [Bacteroidota bacterium]
MRKLLLLLPVCMFVISGFCQQVGSDEALLAARNRIVSDGMEQYSVGDIHAVCYDGTVTGWMVSLSPQGYFAFSANRELPPLIAYSYTNNADMEGRLEALLSTDLAYRLENRLELPAEIITERKTAWNNLLNPEKQKKDVKTQQWPTPGTTSTGGWLETNWTQNAPYNNMCPFDPVTSTRSIAGCPAVAMGMIVNYHETTNGVFFDDGDDYYHNYAGRQYWIDDDYFTIKFPPFPDLNQYLDTLQEHYDAHLAPTNQDMAAIVFACGVAATQVYTSSGSGTFSVNQAFQAYQKFNFTHAELLFDTDTNIYNR